MTIIPLTISPTVGRSLVLILRSRELPFSGSRKKIDTRDSRALLPSKFQDFPGQNSFSRTFQVLGILQTQFSDFQGGMGTMKSRLECLNVNPIFSWKSLGIKYQILRLNRSRKTQKLYHETAKWHKTMQKISLTLLVDDVVMKLNGRMVICFVFPPHLTTVSALPGETRKRENCTFQMLR